LRLLEREQEPPALPGGAEERPEDHQGLRSCGAGVLRQAPWLTGRQAL